MPEVAEHIRRARQDERFAELIRAGDAEFAYWGVAALFYAAVHYGRAYVRHRGAPPVRSHRGFESLFVRHGGDEIQFENYRWLKDESERARYLCAEFSAEDIETITSARLGPFRDWCVGEIEAQPAT